ncbi:HU family DNA-binding protein [Mesoplasma chauliocola]|uniref:HU family DNA-binding protein n=1 Tax=Mesoplasma chauliocola TaxID=216427 RepID=A0A249SMY5_9MOLU|nr:HU family DNA-binding protein [Mesoplasma chauliocola]ASZ08959.1 HU family DNA-binding protein [Mesoplasma chauliocola]
MTKKDLINEIIAKENVSKVECESVINSLFDLITEELSSGNEVSIAGFGKFTISERAAREGINPATSEKITIAASKSAKFKAAKQLKEKLN